MEVISILILNLIMNFGHFCAEIHTGNTQNGLGMKECHDMVEVGIYDNNEAKIWRIISFPDEGYYEEYFRINDKFGNITLEKVTDEKYALNFKLNSDTRRMVIRKYDIKIQIWNYRLMLLKNLKEELNNDYIRISKKKIVFNGANGIINKVKFEKNGTIKFCSNNKGSKSKRMRKIY